jgi:hypothetical protein
MEKNKNNTILRSATDGKYTDELDDMSSVPRPRSKPSSSHEREKAYGLKQHNGSINTEGTGKFHTLHAAAEHGSASAYGSGSETVESRGRQELASCVDEEEPQTTYTTDMYDAAGRRQLGELQKKYDSLDTRYNELREVGVKAAGHNFERMKKQSDDNTAGEPFPFDLYKHFYYLSRTLF